jgi:hypothetical protein
MLAVMGFVVLGAALWLGFARTGGITIGSLEDGNWANMVALTNSQDELGAGNFDSFESPRGTDYVVPAGETLYIVAFIGWPEVAQSADVVFAIGYGDDAVDNSASAPTNPIVVCVLTWESVDSDPVQVALFCPIPAGKFPFVVSSGAGNVQATGTVR